MLVSEAIQEIIHRAGIQGDEFYSENDILAALQTAFEVYMNILMARRPGRLARSLSITPTSQTTPLPGDIGVVRRVVRTATGARLTRIPADSPQFPTGEAWDTRVTERGLSLVVSPSLVGVQLTISYIPRIPTLKPSNPTNDPSVWTEIPEAILPVHGIIQRAIAEILLKDREATASGYIELSEQHLRAWSLQLASQTMDVDGQSTAMRVVGMVMARLSDVEPDLAREDTILEAVRQALWEIHRVAAVLFEDVLKTFVDIPVTSWPMSVTRPDIHVPLGIFVKNADGSWAIAGHGDRTAPMARSGDFYDFSPALPTGMTIHLWSVGRTQNPVLVRISYIPTPPVVDEWTSWNETIYPPSLIVPRAAMIVAGQNRDLIPILNAEFTEAFRVWGELTRQTMYWRSFSRGSRRLELIEMVRHLIGSPYQAEWRNQTIEITADLVRQQIARQIRLIHQGFFEKDHSVTITSAPLTRISMPEKWVRIIGVYYYPSGQNVRAVVELQHGDRDSPSFSYVPYLWDNDKYDIVLSGGGLIAGTVVVRYLTHPAAVAGVIDSTEPDEVLFPLDIVAYLTAARLMVGLGEPEMIQRGQYLEGMAQFMVKAHIAEVARMFHRGSPKRPLPLRLSGPPASGVL